MFIFFLLNIKKPSIRIMYVHVNLIKGLLFKNYLTYLRWYFLDISTKTFSQKLIKALQIQDSSSLIIPLKYMWYKQISHKNHRMSQIVLLAGFFDTILAPTFRMYHSSIKFDVQCLTGIPIFCIVKRQSDRTRALTYSTLLSIFEVESFPELVSSTCFHSFKNDLCQQITCVFGKKFSTEN